MSEIKVYICQHCGARCRTHMGYGRWHGDKCRSLRPKPPKKDNSLPKYKTVRYSDYVNQLRKAREPYWEAEFAALEWKVEKR